MTSWATYTPTPRRGVIRPSGIFLGLVALWLTGALMAWFDFGNANVDVLLFVLAGWVVSLSLHEFSHALFAYRAGDRSVVDKGYLTLNPLKYTHPLLSIVLPLLFLLLGGIGLPGGAVYVDRHAVRSRWGASLISAAGPGANLVFSVVLTLPFVLGADTTEHHTFWAALAFLAFLQFTATVLNLLPIPGLDGGNMLRPWLSHQAGRFFDVVAPFGMLILFAVLFEPIANRIFWDVVFTVTDAVGVPSWLVNEGWHFVHFW